MKLPDAVCGRVKVRPAGSSERGTHQLWISLFIKVTATQPAVARRISLPDLP